MTTETYATEDQFRQFIRDDTDLDEDMIANALLAASRDVEAICGRSFYQVTQTLYFSPSRDSWWLLPFDDNDLATTTGLVVSSEYGLDGTYPDTWTFGTDYIAEPVNQSMGGIAGWPFLYLRSIGGKIWPPRYIDYQRDTVKVTGTFGWPEVPDTVVRATLVLAKDHYKMPDVQFGVSLGTVGAFGPMRVRQNTVVAAMLEPYRKGNTLMMA